MAIEQLYSTDELCEILGISKPTLWRLSKKGEAPRRVRIGKADRYRESDVKAFLEARVA